MIFFAVDGVKNLAIRPTVFYPVLEYLSKPNRAKFGIFQGTLWAVIQINYRGYFNISEDAIEVAEGLLVILYLVENCPT